MRGLATFLLIFMVVLIENVSEVKAVGSRAAAPLEEESSFIQLAEEGEDGHGGAYPVDDEEAEFQKGQEILEKELREEAMRQQQMKLQLEQEKLRKELLEQQQIKLQQAKPAEQAAGELPPPQSNPPTPAAASQQKTPPITIPPPKTPPTNPPQPVKAVEQPKKQQPSPTHAAAHPVKQHSAAHNLGDAAAQLNLLNQDPKLKVAKQETVFHEQHMKPNSLVGKLYNLAKKFNLPADLVHELKQILEEASKKIQRLENELSQLQQKTVVKAAADDKQPASSGQEPPTINRQEQLRRRRQKQADRKKQAADRKQQAAADRQQKAADRRREPTVSRLQHANSQPAVAGNPGHVGEDLFAPNAGGAMAAFQQQANSQPPVSLNTPVSPANTGNPGLDMFAPDGDMAAHQGTGEDFLQMTTGAFTEPPPAHKPPTQTRRPPVYGDDKTDDGDDYYDMYYKTFDKAENKKKPAGGNMFGLDLGFDQDVSDAVDNDLDYYDMYTKTFATAKDKTPAAPAAFSQHNPAGDSSAGQAGQPNVDNSNFDPFAPDSHINNMPAPDNIQQTTRPSTKREKASKGPTFQDTRRPVGRPDFNSGLKDPFSQDASSSGTGWGRKDRTPADNSIWGQNQNSGSAHNNFNSGNRGWSNNNMNSHGLSMDSDLGSSINNHPGTGGSYGRPYSYLGGPSSPQGGPSSSQGGHTPVKHPSSLPTSPQGATSPPYGRPSSHLGLSADNFGGSRLNPNIRGSVHSPNFGGNNGLHPNFGGNNGPNPNFRHIFAMDNNKMNPNSPLGSSPSAFGGNASMRPSQGGSMAAMGGGGMMGGVSGGGMLSGVGNGGMMGGVSPPWRLAK